MKNLIVLCIFLTLLSGCNSYQLQESSPSLISHQPVPNNLTRQQIGQKIKKIIFINWDVPTASLGFEGEVSFKLRQDGSIDNFSLISSNGSDQFDQSIQRAVLKSVPLRLTDAEKIILFNGKNEILFSISFSAK